MNIPLIITVLTALAAIAAILGINAKDVYRFIRAKLQPYPYPVRGEILRCYKVMKKHKGRLGKPISPEEPAAYSEHWTTGTVQRFEGNGDGVEVWDASSNKRILGVSIYSCKYATCPVYGEIGRCYEKHRGSAGRLGFPISYEIDAAKSPQGTTGRVQRFEGNGDGARVWHKPRKDYITAVSIYSSKRGTYPVWGSIGQWFENEKNKGTTGSLGFPISEEDEIASSPRTVRQRFEGGSITCEYGKAPTVQTQ